MRRKKMKMSDEHINDQLNKAQQLLWGGSETENIEAHNIISKLIKDRMEPGKTI
jgi:tetrahydromethanopterin S-methyltransferase subunit A